MRVTDAVPIALVLNTFDAGGTEHQMTELICRLNRARFSVHAACLGDRGLLRSRVVAAGVPIAEFPMWGFARPGTTRQALRFARWCRRRRIRIVHACDFYANIFALPAAALARVPVRIGSRRDVSVPERGARHLALQRLSYHLAHSIAANSTAALQRLVTEGVERAKVTVIPNGLDPQRFGGASRGADGPVVTVTTVANLRPGKGHEVLLDAARRVLARSPHVRFQIVGDGPRRAALEEEAARLGVSDRVRFAGHCDDVPGVLADTDVFAFPSFMEASPNAVLEAMAAGVATVASNVGGIPEAIADRRNGLLVPPGDAEALAAAITTLIEQPELRARLGQAARQDIGSRYSFERMVEAFESLYLSQLARRAPRSAPAIVDATAA